MSARIRRHVRSNVVGYVAVFMSLCIGTAWAGTPNSVDSGDIINGQVLTPDLGNGAVKAAKLGGSSVRSNKVLDDTNPAGGLEAQDLDPASVGASEVADQSLNELDLGADAVFDDEVATGGVNSRGILNGTVGAADLGIITQRSAVSGTIGPGGNGSVTANCNANEQLVSGGNDGFFDVFVVASRQQGNGWAVFAHNDSAGNRTITAHAYCLEPGV